MYSCKAKTKTVCPQHSKQNHRKKEKKGAYLPRVRRGVRSQVPGERGKLGEVSELQCEVRWEARRMVARRAQGAGAMLVDL